MTERYEPTGVPITARERELLTVLIEECAEVSQAACKLLRFGREVNPRTRVANAEELALEVGDLRCVEQMMIEEGVIDATWVAIGRTRKRERLAKYLQTDPDQHDGDHAR